MGDTTTADFSDCSVLGSVEQQSRSDFLPGEQSERKVTWQGNPSTSSLLPVQEQRHVLVLWAWQMLPLLPTFSFLLNLFYIPMWENDSFCFAIFHRRPLTRIDCNIFFQNVLLGEKRISINSNCCQGVDSDIFVLHVLSSYVAKAEAKEGLTLPEISGIFAGFKPGEYFLGRTLIICLFLSWKLLLKIILKFLDGMFNNSRCSQFLSSLYLRILCVNQEVMLKAIIRDLLAVRVTLLWI